MKATKPTGIAMTSCKSSQVAAHGYDATTKTLAIRFNSGQTYHYENVQPGDYTNLCKAKSVGVHLHTAIKPKFKCKPFVEKKGAAK